MATPQQLDLVFEFDVRKAEKKVANSTKSLVMSILQEAGFDGSWEVRDSRQIKKKGRERFGVIRLESRSGRVGVRMWCKPRGNETCFEYSLIPPSSVDVQEAFAVLKRVNGVTLKIPESGVIPLAIKGRMLDVPPIPTKIEKVVEVEDALAEEERQGSIETSAKVHADPYAGTPEFPSLVTHLGEHGDIAIDKALIAMGFVAVKGYAKRTDAFDSMVKNMGLQELSEKRGVELDETLRILTSAMKDYRQYIRRVRHSEKGRKSNSEGVVGFKITGKGQERLEQIRSSYGPEVEKRLGDGWRSEEAPVVDVGVVKSEASSAVLPDAIARIKDLVASYEEAARQVDEHNQVLKPLEEAVKALESEILNLRREEDGLNARIRELQDEISAIDSKRSVLEVDLEKKSIEKKEWEDLKRPYTREKARVEAILSGLGILK